MHPIAQQQLRQMRRSFPGDLFVPVPAEQDRPQAEAAQARWALYIQATFGEDLQPQIAQHAWDMPYWMEQIETRLYEDLTDYCTTPAEGYALRQAALAYLPLQNANACAMPVDSTTEGGLYAIVLELGLIWMSFQLTQALLLAAEGWDEAAHDTYQRVLRGYHAPQLAPAFRIWRDGGSMVDDERVSLEAGAVSTVILRFVALHELGHVVLGHVERAGMTCVSQPKACEVRYAHAATLGQAGTWAMEEAADAFAIEHMLARTGSAQQMWNNLLFIGLMFRFWDHLWQLVQPEGTPWPDDQTHPPPLDRLAQITRQVEAALGPPPNEAPQWAEQTFARWCQPWPCALADDQARNSQ